MDKENVVYMPCIFTLWSVSHKEECSYVICRKMDGTADDHFE
jgi:hypothetical protein